MTNLTLAICVYNAEKYIKETLESVMAQTMQDFHLLIVNDCSTDESLAVIEKFFAEHPRQYEIITLEKNGGIANARNFAISHATTKYFLFIDSDDLLEPTLIEKEYNFGYGLSYTTFRYDGLNVNKKEFGPDDVLEFEVTVSNTGNVAGKEAVLLYSSDLFASLVPDSRRLRAFEKISLEPGESRVVKLAVTATDLAFVNYDGKWTLEEGDFRIQVGDQVTMVHCNTTKVWDEPNID